MYRVLLVDDDPIVLVQLRKIIDWNRLECELAAEASNGEEAIRAIEVCDPQIVITDISMPGISGVDLIQYIQKRGKNTQVIALSAFDDFEYVRESMKGGALDYLLKHQITGEAMEEALLGAISQLDMEEGGRLSYSVREKKEHLMYQLLHTDLSEKDVLVLKELGLSWLQGKMVVALGSMEGLLDEENRELTFVLMDEAIKFYLEYQILPMEKGLFLILFRAKEEEKKEIRAMAEQIQRNLKRICDIELSFAISDVIMDYSGIRQAVEVCRQLLEESFLRGKHFFFVEETERLSGCVEAVRQAVYYIEKHYQERISLADLAKILSVSPSYLSRVFKKNMGVNVMNYVNQIKMQQARKRMDEGRLSLNEIALETGFQNYNYFYMIFKEVYGITPSDYIKSRKK